MFGTALATNGNILAASAAYENSGDSRWVGSVSVFEMATRQQRFRLPNPDPHAEDYFGVSLAIDRGTLLVGSLETQTGSGRVYLYDLQNGTPQGTLYPNDGTTTPGQWLGYSLAVADDSIAVGAVAQGGSVYVFDRETREERFRVTPPANPPTYNFGCSVALGGGKLIVGAYIPLQPFFPYGYDSVFVFDAHTGALLHRITRNLLDFESFGYSLAANDKVFVVGAPQTHGRHHLYETGAVYGYDLETAEQLFVAYPPHYPRGAQFGSSLAVYGSDFAVGSPGIRQERGAVYILKGQ
jgi:hypothetical protein